MINTSIHIVGSWILDPRKYSPNSLGIPAGGHNSSYKILLSEYVQNSGIHQTLNLKGKKIKWNWMKRNYLSQSANSPLSYLYGKITRKGVWLKQLIFGYRVSTKEFSLNFGTLCGLDKLYLFIRIDLFVLSMAVLSHSNKICSYWPGCISFRKRSTVWSASRTYSCELKEVQS